MKPSNIRKALREQIERISQAPQPFLQDPDRNFTRIRKLTFRDTVSMVLFMEGGSTTKELLEYFNFSRKTPTRSALTQSRRKIHPKAFEALFHAFTSAFTPKRLYRGYRLLAVDGSDVQIPTDETDAESYFPGSRGQKPFNITKICALYDLMNHTYEDALVVGKSLANENKLLVQMVERYRFSKQSIIIGDRNFECFDTMAHIQDAGHKFVFRVKETKGIASGLDLPREDEYDVSVNLSLTRKRAKDTVPLFSDRNRFRFVPNTMRFDLLPPGSDAFYELKFRIVRFKLSNGAYEMLVTNLNEKDFPPDELKKLYSMRWGVETSFRKLKYTLALLDFHSKKPQHILQEIWAKLTIYNFTELLASTVKVKKRDRKHSYAINFSSAATICRAFLRGRVRCRDVKFLIAAEISPVRPGRCFPRKSFPKSYVSFAYRAS